VLLKALRLRNVSEVAPEPTMKVTLRPKRELWMRAEPRTGSREPTPRSQAGALTDALPPNG